MRNVCTRGVLLVANCFFLGVEWRGGGGGGGAAGGSIAFYFLGKIMLVKLRGSLTESCRSIYHNKIAIKLGS